MDQVKAIKLLSEGGIERLCLALMDYDYDLYAQAKENEGQLNYLRYQGKIEWAVQNYLYTNLYGSAESVATSLAKKNSLNKQTSVESKFLEKTILLLHNPSLAAHISVLTSMQEAFLDSFRSDGLYIAVLFKDVEYAWWKDEIQSRGFTCIPQRDCSPFQTLMELRDVYRPKQYIWWGPPVYQWLSPLIDPGAIHRSVSFKYDVPQSPRFNSHHIGYGKNYASKISSVVPVYGFHQPITLSSMPGVLPSQLQEAASKSQMSLRTNAMSTRSRINIGVLARAEKVAQPSYLDAILQILHQDNRLVFHWTGQHERGDISAAFEKYGLATRHHFHGWVNPYDFLCELDLYLDTFPFGTGQSLVMAGYMGLPIISLVSPYEASFTNLFNNFLLETLTVQSAKDYVARVLDICAERHEVPIGSELHDQFRLCFDRQSLIDLPAQLAL